MRNGQETVDVLVEIIDRSIQGGLVAKKALCLSSESAVENETVLSSDTIGVCFLGTPHIGSDLASLAAMVSNFLKLTRKRVNSSIVEVLHPRSEGT